MVDQVLAQAIGVTDKVSESSSSIGSCFLFLILEEIYQQGHARSKVLIEDIIVEASVSHCEASKLPSVLIRVSAALNGSLNQSKLQQLFIEEPCMSAKVTYQVAHLCSDSSIFVQNQGLQLRIDIGCVDVFIEVF